MAPVAGRLAALWSKAPAKPAGPEAGSGAVGAASASHGGDASKAASADAEKRREESPYHEQENRGAMNGTPSAAVQVPLSYILQVLLTLSS